jgi:hypothetical protein
MYIRLHIEAVNVRPSRHYIVALVEGKLDLENRRNERECHEDLKSSSTYPDFTQELSQRLVLLELPDAGHPQLNLTVLERRCRRTSTKLQSQARRDERRLLPSTQTQHLTTTLVEKNNLGSSDKHRPRLSSSVACGAHSIVLHASRYCPTLGRWAHVAMPRNRFRL